MLRKSHWSRPSALLVSAALGLLLLSAVPHASADQPIWQLTRTPGVQPQLLQLAQQGISIQEAVEQVRKRYKGQVIKAAETEVQGRPAYRVRLVHEGRVREVLVDAESGQILK